MMRRGLISAPTAMLLALLATGSACGQAEESKQSQEEGTKDPAPDPANKSANKPAMDRFDDWVLVCNESENKAKPSCSLVQTLVEQKSRSIVFRLRVGYDDKGNLVLIVRSPTNVALQKGFEFSPDGTKIYRLPFQTCAPQGCRAAVIVQDALLQEMKQADKGTVAVYALNGQAVRARISFLGFTKGLAELDKRH
jgi:invasion protein IalB